jgi:lipoprotein NlpI
MQPLYFVNRGIAYQEKRNYDHAIQDFDRAIKLDPKYAQAFHSRGISYSSKKEYDRAIQDLDQSILLNPLHAPAFNSRGLAYVGKRDYSRAIQDYDQSIKLDPKNPHAFYNRGRAYFDILDFERAAQSFDQALLLNPAYGFAFAERGLVEICTGQLNLAQKDLTEAFRIQPSINGAVWLHFVAARNGGDDRAEFEKNLTDLRRSAFFGAVTGLFLGTIEPQALLDAAKSPDPKVEDTQLCEAHFFLGERALIAGNRPEAITEFQKALEAKDPSLAEYIASNSELRRLSSANPR